MSKISVCYPWPYMKAPDGYGRVKYKSRSYSIPRLLWQGLNGAIPPGMVVMHKCDNPPCCNPTHLILGTRADNNKDRAMKKRSAIGERSGRAKLTEIDVKNIRETYKLGQLTQTTLGNVYGVSNHQISMIVRGLSWSHI